MYLNAKNAKTVRKACEEKVKWKDGDGMSLAPCITAQKKADHRSVRLFKLLLKASQVEALFLLQVVFFRVNIILIRNAAIYRANGSTLWLFVKTNALGAFVGNDVVGIHFLRLLGSIGRSCEATESCEFTFH